MTSRSRGREAGKRLLDDETVVGESKLAILLGINGQGTEGASSLSVLPVPSRGTEL